MVYSDLRIGAAGDRIHADDRLYSGDRGSGADGGNHVEEGVSVALSALGIFLPLITTNCAVLGVAILMISKEFNLLQSIVYSVATAIGFALALVLFAGIRERLELEDVPKAVQGVPVALITAGILAMAFMGFSGLV